MTTKGEEWDMVSNEAKDKVRATLIDRGADITIIGRTFNDDVDNIDANVSIVGQTSNDGEHVILKFNNVVHNADASVLIVGQTPNDGEYVIMKALIDGGANG